MLLARRIQMAGANNFELDLALGPRLIKKCFYRLFFSTIQYLARPLQYPYYLYRFQIPVSVVYPIPVILFLRVTHFSICSISNASNTILLVTNSSTCSISNANNTFSTGD